MTDRHHEWVRIVLTTALIASPLAALAADKPAYSTGFYVGGFFSQADIKISGAPSLNPQTLALLGGYRFSRNFAGELRGGFGIKSETLNGAGGSADFKVKDYTSVLLRGSLPVSDTFSVYALAGYTSAKLEVSSSLIGGTASGSDNGFTYGAGLEVRFGPEQRSAVMVEYEKLYSTSDYDLNAISLGYAYSLN